LTRCPTTPCATLDALHLAAARGIGADSIATADKTLAEAAAALGLTVQIVSTESITMTDTNPTQPAPTKTA
jgi:hypothetical protein